MKIDDDVLRRTSVDDAGIEALVVLRPYGDVLEGEVLQAEDLIVTLGGEKVLTGAVAATHGHVVGV